MQSRVTQEDLWIDTPHGRMFARRWRPNGPDSTTGQAPFILFHDSLGCVELWRDFPGQLAAATNHEVIAYDRLGYGRSDAHPGGWSPDFIRDEAQHYFPLLRERLDLGHFIAFGHSVGGAMAATCAFLYPQACLSLITESAQAFVEDRTLHGISQAKEDFRKPGQIERLQKYHGDKADWVLNAWTETWLSGEFADWTIERAAPSVKCPLLVIHGGEDEYGSLCHPPRIAQLTSASSESLILPGCHHLPHREMPERVLGTVMRFIHEAHC